MLYQMQKTRGLYFHTCLRVFKNRGGTITLFNLSTHKLKVPSISNVHWLSFSSVEVITDYQSLSASTLCSPLVALKGKSLFLLLFILSPFLFFFLLVEYFCKVKYKMVDNYGAALPNVQQNPIGI